MENLFKTCIDTAKNLLNLTQKSLAEATAEKGQDASVSFPDTAYYIPLIYALHGTEIKTLKDVEEFLKKLALPQEIHLENALNCGAAVLTLAEIIASLKYLKGELPEKDSFGFFSDGILRSLGIQLVDGRIPGFALIIGAAPTDEDALNLVRNFQQKNILSFVGGSYKGKSIIDQLLEKKVEMGWENYVVPYGRDIVSAVFPVNWAVRAALSYGGIKGGDTESIRKYIRERVPAFALKLGEPDEIEVAVAFGAIYLGVPVILNMEFETVNIPGLCANECIVGEPNFDKLVETSLQVRGIKIKQAEIPIPLPFSAAFEGERVRKEDTFVQFGGKYSKSVEFLTSKSVDEIEDGKVEVRGKDIDEMKEGETPPLGILVEVAGRKMLEDYEPIIERQIHHYLNYCHGILHMGQRNLNWIRISKEAVKKGFKLEHIGKIIHAKIHDGFGTIVDRVQITITTLEKEVEDLIENACNVYKKRDERIKGLTDEEVDEFYTCLLCQSFAPNHVCIVKPERIGLCGAYNWLDCKVSYEINPSGANQPVKKGKLLDPEKGEWEGINRAVWEYSNKTIERFHAYSIMSFPETGCGCFEVILAIIPEANGFMAVNREYTGMTPAGMTFTTLAGSVGGGQQTPGFMGIGKLYLLSKKFIKADGGIKRIVWMPSELKEFLGEEFKKRCIEEGVPDLVDKIADEKIATTPEELVEFLEKVNHPALTMPPLF